VLIFLAVVFLVGVKNSQAVISEKINYQGKLTDSSNVTVADGAYDIVFNLYTTAGGGSPIWTESWTNSALFTNSGTTFTNNGCAAGVDRMAYTGDTNEGTLSAGQYLWNTTKKESAVIESVSTSGSGGYICFYDPYSTWASSDAISNRIYVRSGIFSTMLGSVQSLSAIDFNQTLYLGVTIGGDPEMQPRKVIGSAPSAFTAKTLNNNGTATIATNAGATISIGNTTGAATVLSGGASSWANTSGNLTVSTVTSGTLAVTSAGALNLSAAAASTATLANVADAFNFDSNTLSVDALNNRIGIGTAAPTAFLDIAASTTGAASLRLQTGVAPTTPNIGDMWFNGTNLYFRKDGTTSQDLLASSGSGPWTDGTGVTYITDTAEDLAIGAATLVAPFSVDVSLNTARIGTGATNNGILNMYASDGDTGSLAYTTDDAWTFTGGNVGIGTTQPWSALHVTSSVLWGSNVYLEATNAGADFPVWTFKKSRAGASVNAWDSLGEMKFAGVNSTGSSDSDFGTIIGIAEDPTSGSEDGNFMFSVVRGGAMIEQARFSGPEGVNFNYQNSPNVDFTVSGDTISQLIFADASTDTIGIGVAAPKAFLSLAGATAGKSSLNIATGTAPTGGNLYDGDMWYETGHLYFRDTTTKDLLAGGGMAIGGTISNSPNDTSILFVNGSVLAQDTNFTWNTTNDELGIGVAPTYRVDVATAVASDRGVNISNTAATGTNYGIFSSVTGAATANYGGNFASSGAVTNYGVNIAGMTGSATALNNYGVYVGTITSTSSTNAVNYGIYVNGITGVTAEDNATNVDLYLGNITGSTTTSSNIGLKMGTITSTSGTGSNYGIQLGAISGATNNSYGISLNTLTGGVLTNTQIATGQITVTGAVTGSYALNLGGLTGTANAATNAGINLGAINSAGTTSTNYGIRLSTMTGGTTANYQIATGALTNTGTTNIQLDLGGLSGSVASSNNYGIRLGAISSAGTTSNNYGISLGTLTGGTTSNTQIATGAITITSVSNYGLNIGGLSGSVASSNNYGINVGAISSAGATSNNYGMNITSITGGVTANYGLNVGAITTTGATNSYGLNVAAMTGTGASSYGLNVMAATATGTNVFGMQINGATGGSANSYGLNVTVPINATGHKAGIEIGAASTASGNWALYSGDTNGSYLAGNLGLGTAVTTTSFLSLGAHTTAKSSLNIPSSGGAVLSAPVIGDMWFNGTSLYFRKDGSTSSDLLAAGAGMSIGGSISSSTSGSILYANSSNQMAQDNANFFWDATNKRLGIGTTAPSQALTVNGSIRLAAGVTNSLVFQDGTTMTTAAATSTGYTSTTDLNFAADSDTNGSGTMFFATNGLERIRVTNAGLVGVGTASGTAQLAVNTTGTNNLLQLQKAGLDKFVVDNKGGVTVNGTSANNVKTTTGTTNVTDFSFTGSTFTNVTSQNDEVDIDAGSVVTTFSSAAANTAVNAGAGSHSIVRDDGRVIVVHGGGAATGSSWDGSSATMTSVTVASAASVGAGAISLKRPNGRYLLVHGNGSAGLSSVYDPWNITAAAAGPAVCGGGATTTGTNAFMRPDGKYVIMCGGLTAWGVYDPSAAVAAGYTAGTVVASAFGAGAFAIQRDDGTFLVFRGGSTTTHWIYNPFAGATGTWTINPITTNMPTISTGAFAIRRNDGKYLIVGGAINTSTIYNPTTTTSNSGAGAFELINGGVAAAGFGPITTALADAAQVVRRQDGKYLMVHGGASTLTDIIDPSVTTNQMFLAGTALNNAMGAGGHFVPRPDGKYAIIRGGAATPVDTYDMGFVMGGNGSGSQLSSYETECMTATSLNQSSTLNWTANMEGTLIFQVKTGTGSCSGAYKNILNSGDLIRPVAGDNRVQVKVFFKRPFFIGYDQEWSLWRGLSQPRYRAKVADPTLYDIKVDNSSQLHRSLFDFGIGTNNATTDPSGPVSSNLNVTMDGKLQLAAGVGMQNLAPTTVPSPTLGLAYGGAYATQSALTTGALEGTIVMRRPDGTFLVIAGNAATANAQVYDQNTGVFTANANGVYGATCSGNCVPTTYAKRGALAFKRPDGKYLVVLGGASTTTNIYDPVASTFTAGPAVTANVARGSQVIPLPNGRVLIIHGNTTATTSIYDPIQNIMLIGPSSPVNVGPGSLVIPNVNGTWLLIPGLPDTGTDTAITCGTPVTTSTIFDSYSMLFSPTASAPTIVTGTGPGALALQRSDGLWVITKGGAVVTTCATTVLTTHIYNPTTGKIVAGPSVITQAPGQGSHVIQRPDGNRIIVNGGGTATSQVYIEKDIAATHAFGEQIGLFVAGGPAPAAIGSGSVSFQRDDGKQVTISGGTTTTAISVGTVNTGVQMLDLGWAATGAYRTEQINVSDLSTDSTLNWKATPNMNNISAEVRTATSQLGLQLATSRDITTSGGLINPGGSETWIQIQFNFKRIFPNNPGIWSDVWWNGGSTMAFNLRTITNPTLSEFKVSKDVDLVNLKSDGLSMFRVGTNGSIYTSATGVINSGGADLAENYTSNDALEKGEIVAIDPSDNHNVKRSALPYQNDLLGVVSTAPGFVAGSYTKDSHPIALVGRVPVKVSSENGMIREGDRITSASIPGFGMRATFSGRVIGTALESMDSVNLETCPAGGYIMPNAKCGEIMVFVNLVDYSGMSVDTLMAESNDDTESETETVDQSSPFAQFATQGKILNFLKKMRATQTNYRGSDILTSNVSAIGQVVSPLIVTDTLIAKNIKAENIEGLQFIQTGITDAQNGVSTNATEVKNLGQQLIDLQTMMKALTDKSNGVDADAVKEMAVSYGLVESGPAEFKGQAIFKAIAEFVDKVIFRNNVEFAGQVIFNEDSAGYAIVNKGENSVKVEFAKEYANVPIINASLSVQDIKDEELRSATEDLILATDVKYLITNVTTKGFEIKINNLNDWEIPFAWQAVSVKDAKTTQAQIEKKDAPEPKIETVETVDVPRVEEEKAPAMTEIAPVETVVPAENVIAPEVKVSEASVVISSVQVSGEAVPVVVGQ
jgi:hypothetical protein